MTQEVHVVLVLGHSPEERSIGKAIVIGQMILKPSPQTMQIQMVSFSEYSFSEA